MITANLVQILVYLFIISVYCVNSSKLDNITNETIETSITYTNLLENVSKVNLEFNAQRVLQEEDTQTISNFQTTESNNVPSVIIPESVTTDPALLTDEAANNVIIPHLNKVVTVNSSYRVTTNSNVNRGTTGNKIDSSSLRTTDIITEILGNGPLSKSLADRDLGENLPNTRENFHSVSKIDVFPEYQTKSEDIKVKLIKERTSNSTFRTPKVLVNAEIVRNQHDERNKDKENLTNGEEFVEITNQIEHSPTSKTNLIDENPTSTNDTFTEGPSVVYETTTKGNSVSVIKKLNQFIPNENIHDNISASPSPETSVITVRKCCQELEYFSLVSFSCEATTENELFYSLIFGLLHLPHKEQITLNSATLQCPGNEPPKTINNVSNDTFLIIDNGNIYDVLSTQIYNNSEYCLELLGEDSSQTNFTLVYCEKYSQDYLYYDYTEQQIQDYYTEEKINTENYLTVRKCCQEYEYFNSELHKCVHTEDPLEFHNSVQEISFDSANAGVNIISLRLTQCPNNVGQPSIHDLDKNIYRLQINGDLINTNTGAQYNYSYYCLEQLGPTPESVELKIALCNKANYMLPKCCPSNRYFDEDELDCVTVPSSHSLNRTLLQEYTLDNNTYALEALNYFLLCKTIPEKALANKFVINSGSLCMQENCYSGQDFCIDYVGDSSIQELQAIAYYCPKDYFVKCCIEGEILNESGCSEHSDGKSLLLKQLTRTKNIVRNFNYQACPDEKILLLEDSFTEYVHWWNSGNHLVVESSTELKEIQHYCIDDFKAENGKVTPVAYVCEADVENMIPIAKPHRNFQKKGSLAKCCPKSPDPSSVYLFSSSEARCQLKPRNVSSGLSSYFNDFGYTTEHFHDFPKCSKTGVGYHSYPLTSGNGDYARLTSRGNLEIISMDGKCVQDEKLINYGDFCFDFIVTQDDKLPEPLAVICAYTSVIEIYHEKFGLITTLLGISIACLFATLVSLCNTRVRRGLVSTRKVNTLAGQILVSFVGSHLIGFIALSLTQYENSLNKITSPGCYVLAGCIQFFNLAAFCWNTSICLESLLLTIHIKISECLRYFLHSLWAWGFPAIMTLLMLLMDAYREELPCGTITPKIGVHHCFHSDTNARLLYFYVPIFFTLTSNVLFLVGAKTLRTSRLKRLEKGKPKPRSKSAANGHSSASGNAAPVHSGMRTHQTQNTKVESVRLVLWTGGTWFLELAGFVVTKYILPHSEERWYDYLWYIPTSVNALRGVGIFCIIVLTPETRNKISGITATFRNTVNKNVRKIISKDVNEAGKKNYANDHTPQISFKENRTRKMSITTMISNISYFRNSFIIGNVKSSRKKYAGDQGRNDELNGVSSNSNQEDPFSMARSVSQIGRQSSVTSVHSLREEIEMENEAKKRKCSLPLSTIPLPKLKEEDIVQDEAPETVQLTSENSSSSEV